MEEVKLTKSEKDSALKKEVLDNYKYAKSSKEPINRKVQKWVDTYNGKLYGNEQDARSKVIVRDVYKTIEALKPSLIEPFIGSPKPIDGVPYTAQGEEASIASEKLLNYQFTTQQDRRSLMNTVANIVSKEGTVWIKNEWKYEDEEFRTKMTVPKEAVGLIQDEYEIIADNGDTLDIEVIEVEVVKNEPSIKLCRNEHIFTDPTAEIDEDIQFIIHQYDMTMSDLREAGVYKNLDKLEGKVPSSLRDTSLGTARDMDAVEFGRDTNYRVFGDEARTKITIMEYWGYYDLNDDGIAEPVLIVWEKNSEIIIREEENPMPDKEIPFERAVYIEEPFSLWGKALADAMDDGQRIHTAFMRGMIDNAALSNNGQKFIMKGGIDQMNFRRMINGEKHIYTNQNPSEVIQDGSYNQLPQSMLNMYEMVELQNEGITGISRSSQGLNNNAMNGTAAGASIMATNSQRRMLDTVRNISNMLRKSLRRQLRYSLHFLEEEDWIRITGMYKPQGKLGKDFDIKIQLITDAMKQAKISQYLQMFQNLQYVSKDMQFEVSNMILSKYYDILDEPTIAEAIRNQKPPKPDPTEQQGIQLEMQKMQAEIQKLQADSQKSGADASKTMAEISLLGIDSNNKQGEMKLKAMEAQMQLQLDRDRANNSMIIEEEKSENEKEIAIARAKLELLLSQQKAEADLEIQRAKTQSDLEGKIIGSQIKMDESKMKMHIEALKASKEDSKED